MCLWERLKGFPLDEGAVCMDTNTSRELVGSLISDPQSSGLTI